jgi:hypothetical protein
MIFISYRRQDCRHLADRLYEALSPHFDVFMDVHDIDAGDCFPEVLRQNLEKCQLLLAVIGPQWLTITDASGRRRLDDPNDFVRREIEAVLKQGKRILPILADGARMPSEDELPASLRPLVEFQAVPVGPNPAFTRNADELIQALDDRVCRKPPPFPERLLLPPRAYATMYPHWREGVWYVVFFWALVAAALGGLLANFALPMLLDRPESRPHGRAALAWPLLTLLPIFLVLYRFNVRLRLLDPWLQGGLFAGFLAGELMASWLYYDLPGPGLTGARQLLHSLQLPFAVEEFVLVILWSGLLSGLGFLGWPGQRRLPGSPEKGRGRSPGRCWPDRWGCAWPSRPRSRW